MSKWMRHICSLILIIGISLPVLAQEKYNTLYQPLSLVKRLSYENFRNIKLLTAAIINYGGGEAELEKVVDQYAEASALYFQNKLPEAAAKFTENERTIFKIAQDLAKKYRADSEAMFLQATKTSAKISVMRALEGNKPNENSDIFIGNSRYAWEKGNDYYDRYINATSAPSRELIIAIYYYRKVKESIINLYSTLEFSNDSKKNQEMKEQILAKYKKDIEDSKNKIYKSMEKQN